ncbi:hypothetical protein ACO1O0_000696 [Amphichorda felina]
MGSTTLPPGDAIPIPRTTAPMPCLGYGVYKIPPSAAKEACLTALEAGYRHIDCAQLYRSESQVGDAVGESPVPRDQVFLTTKFKKASGGEGSVYEQLLDSVRRIDGPDGYVDLFLIHTPRFNGGHTIRQVWEALEKLHSQGRARAIGVSNFGIQHIKEMKAHASIWPPHVNQIEVRATVPWGSSPLSY